MDKSAIRDAATIILLRQMPGGPAVLMGQRGASAAFMPGKFVFPGGAVDLGDRYVRLGAPALPDCLARLALHAKPGLAISLAAAAIRELWEEAGLVLGLPGSWADPPPDWASFAATGHSPDAAALRFVFRAITPPGSPRRFDARFFLADAAHVAGDPDDFSAASDELTHLQWIPLTQVRRFDLPFVTEIVLAEIAALIPFGGAPSSVPFFDNSSDVPIFRRLI